MLHLGPLTDLERIKAFAAFLGLSVRQLEKIAIRHKFSSRSTFQRIHRDDTADATGQRGKPTLAKLAELVSPHFLAGLSAEDRFLEPELASRLLGVGNRAWHRWAQFLEGDTIFAPRVQWLEEEIARIYEPRARADRGEQLQRLRQHLESVQTEALQAGAIEPSPCSPSEMLRWQWRDANTSAELWLRMRTALCLAQTRIEETAAIVYLAAPIIPLALLPLRVCQQWMVATLHPDAGAEVQIQADKRWNRRNRRADADGAAMHVPRESGAAVEATNLLKAFGARYWNFQMRSGQRQVVVALFSEQRTREFFERLTLRQRLACEKELAALVRRGLVLLAAQMTEQEERALCASLTLGGDSPGYAVSDEVIAMGAKERNVAVGLAGTPEYVRARERFDAVANRTDTRRLTAEAVSTLVLPKSALKAREMREQRRYDLDPWDCLDL